MNEDDLSDSCLFELSKSNEKFLISIYLGVELIAGTNIDGISDFVRELKCDFKITMGSLDNQTK